MANGCLPNVHGNISKFFKGGTHNKDVNKMLRAFVADETAVTAIEYALIAGGISIVILAAVNSVGSALNGLFASISTLLP